MVLLDIEYWVRLSYVLSVGGNKADTFFKHFTSPREFFEAGERAYSLLKLSGEERVRVSEGMDKAHKIIEKCVKLGIELCPYSYHKYPEQLKSIYDAPLLLYYKGNIDCITDKLCLAVVGTRQMTPYGEEITDELSFDLARAGAVIVSGLATGIDGTAHRAALRAKRPTVAVMGCGIGVDYPFENKHIKEQIAETGLLLSELPPDVRPFPKYFPIRNRIMSGLSDGVLVTEAPEKSGALITAEYALSHGKEVFAVPNDILSAKQGTNLLIKQGAVPAVSALDILNHFMGRFSFALDLSALKGRAAPPPAKRDNPPAKPKPETVPEVKPEPVPEVTPEVTPKPAPKPIPEPKPASGQPAETAHPAHPVGTAPVAVAERPREMSQREAVTARPIKAPLSHAPVRENKKQSAKDSAVVTAKRTYSEPEFTRDEITVLNFLKDGRRQFGDMLYGLNMSVPALSLPLTMLEIKGVIRMLPGKYYEICD